MIPNMFTFIVLREKREKKEVEGLTVTSGQWPVKPAPPIIIIMHRDGVILCKAGLRSPAVWGLVSKAYSTTSRKLFRIIHLPKPVYCSESRFVAMRSRNGVSGIPVFFLFTGNVVFRIFGHVHGGVRGAEKVVLGGAILGIEGNADAC